MQVQPINRFYMYENNNLGSKKTNSKLSNPTFRWVDNLGEKVLKASESQLKSYAESYRLVPRGGWDDLLEITRIFGIRNDTKSLLALERFKSAVRDVNDEITKLTKSGTKEANDRLEVLNKKANEGLDEYYGRNDSSFDNYDDGDYRGDKYYY